MNDLGHSKHMLAARHVLLTLFRDAVSAVSAESCMRDWQPSTDGRTAIIAVGKAAAAMASVAAPGLHGACSGLVITRYGHSGAPHKLPPDFVLMEAGHPVPDDVSLKAADAAMVLAKGLGRGDHLLMLISGGGSALLSMPAPGVTLAEKQQATRALLHSGATIAEINCVRKHLSLIKGGRLAVAAAPAHVTTLVISDVPGDDPSFVGSGPTIADSTTLGDALDIIRKYEISCAPSIMQALQNPANETPPADTLGLAGGQIHVIARARDALSASAATAEQFGYKVTDLGDHLQAEARHLGAGHAALARRLAASGERRVIISGGETTVSVVNTTGRGGRNLEYLLGLAIALDRAPGIYAIACDTDGIDGTEDNAGAIVTPDTLTRARACGLDPEASLAANEAWQFFSTIGDLVVTGPTRTNVNDFRAILIDPS
jgi:glycerate 2-kinase